MSLTSGSRLGPYEILSPLGAGGMGEVFRARDARLKRDVAIKVLPAGFAEDGERVARFRREAQLVASLNHANIAAIYGLEESNGTVALALELVDGEDLARRLARGPIPVDEAIAIARQIAEGLEAAHERGIVHRDLKPANVKVTRDGAVKILDFGLAKALDGGSADAAPPGPAGAYEGDPGSSDGGLTQSPTMSRQMTEAGMILGTAAYMSPEQARGRPVDKRSDIWAFGVVFFEMLTGRRLFAGETVTDVLAAVLTKEPDLKALPAGTPAAVRRLLSRCLEREPRRRLRDIGEARVALEEPRLAKDAAPLAGAPAPTRLTRLLPWMLTAAAIALAAWALARGAGAGESGHDVMHFEIGFPPGVEPVTGLQGGFALSPDGRSIAIIGVRNGVRRLYVRRLDEAQAAEISDTGGVNSATFSPDSKSVVFVPGSTVVTRMSLADRKRTTVTSGVADLSSSLAWSPAGILYASAGEIWLAPLPGGPARRLTTLDASRHEVLHGDMLALPGGRTILFSSQASEPGTERIEAVSIDGKKRSVVIERAITAAWSPSGHLLFGRDGALCAVPFDARSATVTGAAMTVVPSGVISSIRSGALGFQVAENGTLLYIPSNFASKRVVSVGRDGSEMPLGLPPARYGNPRVSPDGRRLLVDRGSSVIDTVDLVRGTRAVLASSAMGTIFPIWTGDGAAVVSRRFNVPFWVATDGSGKSGIVPSGGLNDYPSAPGPDPDSIFIVRVQRETSGDIFLMSISGKFPPKPVLVTPAYEGGPQLSPDGRFLLYQSNGSGQPEIYVRPYPALDRAWTVSEAGGVHPRWSRSGREIFYRNEQRMMAVAFDPAGAEPTFQKPVALFTDDFDYGQGISVSNYDVTNEGRFILLRRGAEDNTLHAVVNWTEELKKILAGGGTR